MCHGTDLHAETQEESPNLFAVAPVYSLAEFKYLGDDEVAELHAPEAAARP